MVTERSLSLYFIAVLSLLSIDADLALALPQPSSSPGGDDSMNDKGPGFMCTEHLSNFLKGVSPEEDCPGCKHEKIDDPSSEHIDKLRVDLTMSHILQQLRLPRVPCPTKPKPSTETLKNFEQAIPENDVEERDSFDDSMFIRPSNSKFTCVESDTSPCSYFAYKLPSQFQQKDSIYVELWVYPVNESSHHSIKVNISKNWMEDGGNTTLIVKGTEKGWMKFALNTSSLPTKTGEDLEIPIEVLGVPVVETGSKEPFLKVPSERSNSKAYRRGRRNADCVAGSTSCCREKYYFSFAEIGWDNWILRPEGFYGNYCKGKCIMDFSTFRYLYSSVLQTYIKYNHTVAASLGLSVCCIPTELAPLSIIYRDSDNIIHHTSVPDMIVKECGCA